MKRAVVTGGSGFIGQHLVNRLIADGYFVRSVDIKEPEFPHGSGPHEFLRLDLRREQACRYAVQGMDEVYHLGADMGGIQYITSKHADIARNNLLIDANMLEAARDSSVQKFFFSSSACVYPSFKQDTVRHPALKEDDAWPADPEPGYGLEKLVTEKLCEYYRQDYGLETRVGRFHNVYGPYTTYDGGKEKAPAALCRKVAEYKHGLIPHIEIWGHGTQTRSFMYVDDCVEGVRRLMDSDHAEPLNIGSDELVSITDLLLMICMIAGVTLEVTSVRHVDGPVGVQGRNSDNTRIRDVLDWEPSISLGAGLWGLYAWVEAQVVKEASNDRLGVVKA